VDVITEDEFFHADKSFFGVHHPCHYLKMPPHNKFPGAFETNQSSSASISENDDLSVYYQGCLWGGKVPEIFDMIDILSERVDEDLKCDIIAVWHDESHINKFFIERKDDVHTLGSEYAYPEVFSEHCDFDPKIIHLSKDNSKYHQ
jgi:hypothetical protein